MLRKMLFVGVLAILLVGCGAKPSQAAATEITVEVTDFAIAPHPSQYLSVNWSH